MIILNFSHPLTEDQRSEIEALAADAIAGVRDLTTQLDSARPVEALVVALLAEAGLSARQGQNEAVLINPPAYAPVTAVLLAELHGRMGYFPAIIRLRPAPAATPPRFEAAEIINLQQVSAPARERRMLNGSVTVGNQQG